MGHNQVGLEAVLLMKFWKKTLSTYPIHNYAHLRSN